MKCRLCELEVSEPHRLQLAYGNIALGFLMMLGGFILIYGLRFVVLWIGNWW